MTVKGDYPKSPRKALIKGGQREDSAAEPEWDEQGCTDWRSGSQAKGCVSQNKSKDLAHY